MKISLKKYLLYVLFIFSCISCGDLDEPESGTVEYYLSSQGPQFTVKIDKILYNNNHSEVEYTNVNTPLYFKFPVELKPLQRKKEFYIKIYKEDICIQLLILVDGYKVDEYTLCEEEILTWELKRSLFGPKFDNPDF